MTPDGNFGAKGPLLALSLIHYLTFSVKPVNWVHDQSFKIEAPNKEKIESCSYRLSPCAITLKVTPDGNFGARGSVLALSLMHYLTFPVKPVTWVHDQSLKIYAPNQEEIESCSYRR